MLCEYLATVVSAGQLVSCSPRLLVCAGLIRTTKSFNYKETSYVAHNTTYIIMIYFIADDVALLSDCVSAFVRTCAPASFSYFHCSHCNTILLFLFIYLPMFLFIVLFLFSCPFIFKFPFLLLFPFIFPCRTYSYSNQRVTGFFILGSNCFLILIFRDLPEVMLSQWQHWVSTE